MPGRIVAITIAYESGMPGDMQPVLIGLAELRKSCRAERVDDLIEDLAMLVKDVEAVRQPDSPGTVLRVVRGGR